MKTPNKFLLIVLICLLLITLVPARIYQGSMSHISPQAPTLRVSSSMEGGPSPAFAGAVGGVSFEKVAAPSKGSIVNNVNLNYDPTATDGNRLRIDINGNDIQGSLADWLLIPIAQYANSQYTSCFTLFGSLYDKQLEQDIKDKKGYILNYHPFFENTLLGLRLYYMDILILYPHVIYLPQDDSGKPFLGTGEHALNERILNNALFHFNTFFSDLEDQIGYKHRSWIISDFSRDIEFYIENDSLRITQTPYYYFWRNKCDRADYEETVETAKIRMNLDNELISIPKLEQRHWIFSKTITALYQYERDYPLFMHGDIDSLLAMTSDKEKYIYLDQFNHTDIYEHLLVPLLTFMDAGQVEHLKNYSESVSNRTDLLRAINPLVWDASVTTMRYAAFFRYCKQNHPRSWDRFINQISTVSIQPKVKTPTAIFNKKYESEIQFD